MIHLANPNPDFLSGLISLASAVAASPQVLVPRFVPHLQTTLLRADLDPASHGSNEKAQQESSPVPPCNNIAAPRPSFRQTFLELPPRYGRHHRGPNGGSHLQGTYLM